MPPAVNGQPSRHSPRRVESKCHEDAPHPPFGLRREQSPGEALRQALLSRVG